MSMTTKNNDDDMVTQINRSARCSVELLRVQVASL